MDEITRLKKENEELKKEIEKLKTGKANQKKGMAAKASRGSVMSRPAFGYKLENGKIVPAENAREVEDIFEEFLRENISLSQLAANHKFSVNGMKKILKNFTYIGKVKFNNQIFQGNHSPIISTTLFNHVQDKLERSNVK
jgi:site-specific DNA recombinase